MISSAQKIRFVQNINVKTTLQVAPVPRQHSGLSCCRRAQPEQRSATIAPLQASHSSSRQAREKVVAFLDKDELVSLQPSATIDSLLSEPVHRYKDNMPIRAGYAEVWVPKAIKQWLIAEGGEGALKASFRMEITLDGQLVASQPYRCKRKEVGVNDVVRIALQKSSLARVAGFLRGALQAYGKWGEDGKWANVIVLHLISGNSQQRAARSSY